MNLVRLETWDPESGMLNVIIETSKGSRNKLDYDAARGLFQLKKVLPRGSVFPFDFGFIPSTLGDDGDPLDILVLLDEPVAPGCKIPVRLIGIIEAKQTEDGKTERNDRLIAVAHACHEQAEIQSLKDLDPRLVQEIEHFFVSYNEFEGKRFVPIAQHGSHRAEKLVREGAKRFQSEHVRGAGKALRHAKKKLPRAS